MPKRAAIITAFDPFLFKGGIETYTLQLISLLESRHIEVTVYHTGLLSNERKTDHLTLSEFLEDIYRLGKKLLCEEKLYDFIIANSFYGAGYFPPGKETFNIYHSTHAGYISKYCESNRDNPYFKFQYLCVEMAEYVSGYGRKKIAVSDLVKGELESIYGFKDIEVVYSGVDTSLFKSVEEKGQLRQKFGIPQNAFVGIYVGRWEYLKRNNILRSVILHRNDIYWLLVLGSGGEDCEFNNHHNVMIKQGIPYEDMPLMYCLADFMLFPSLYEGFGMVIIEAIACGVPVITTSVGVVPSIYNGKPFEHLLLPEICETSEEDLIAINQKIDLLKKDLELRKEIGEQGIAIVKEKFSIERWRKDMEKVLGI